MITSTFNIVVHCHYSCTNLWRIIPAGGVHFPTSIIMARFVTCPLVPLVSKRLWVASIALNRFWMLWNMCQRAHLFVSKGRRQETTFSQKEWSLTVGCEVAFYSCEELWLAVDTFHYGNINAWLLDKEVWEGSGMTSSLKAADFLPSGSVHNINAPVMVEDATPCPLSPSYLPKCFVHVFRKGIEANVQLQLRCEKVVEINLVKNVLSNSRLEKCESLGRNGPVAFQWELVLMLDVHVEVIKRQRVSPFIPQIKTL